MLGGVLAGGGFHMGDQPLPLDFRPGTNPKGVFEDRETVAINEALLARFFPRPARTRIGRRRQRGVLERGVRWAAVLEPEATVAPDHKLDRRIQAQVATRPFCYKDPRFSFTLPAWRPHVGDALLICIFREPARTANSLVTEWARHPERHSRMTFETGLAHWRAAYGRVLDTYRHDGDWLFVHYDQVLGGMAIPRLEATLGASLDSEFPEADLKRTPAEGLVGPQESSMYAQLCELAGYRPDSGAVSPAAARAQG